MLTKMKLKKENNIKSVDNNVYKKLEKNINDFYYNKPKTNDMAIGFVFFNIAKSNRLLINYLYTTNKLKLSDIPYYTLEVVYNEPEIPEAIHIECKSIMFQKERLCYVLEKHIPEKYTKILFLDCDIIFDNPNWYDDVSKLLNTYNLVHPFTTAIWLDITYMQILEKRDTLLSKKLPYDNGSIWNYHYGFGWAFQRKWYNEIGFFQYCIVGGGDLFSIFSWLNIYSNVHKFITDEYTKFFNFNKPSMSYITGTIYHLYHGSRINRAYFDRFKLMEDIKNIKDILIIEENKPFEFKPQYSYLNDKIKEYLINRDDDSI
jgi:hypothetical protein